MVKNFFNVVIPTRNRLATLRYSLKTVINQSYDNYMVIISDNCSNDGTRDFINGLNCEKVKYYNTGQSLSMSSNFEFAISKVNEGFVIVIGDDDGLLPHALTDINDLLNKENIFAISSKTDVYYWPGGSPNQNLLMVPTGDGGISRKSSGESLKKVLNGDFNYTELPMLYTGGVVHSTLIERARNRDGKFYNSFTPDIYSGIAITSVVDQFLRSEVPFAISGLSKYSNGQSQLGVSKSESIAEDFFRVNDIPFYHALGDGKIKSVHLLTLEAYIQSSFLRGDKDKIDMLRQFEIVVAKAPKNLRNETINYLKINCSFNPAPMSISQIRMHIVMAKFMLINIIERFNRIMFWDAVPVGGKVGNVYEASEYITKTKLRIIDKILYKLKYVKSKIGKMLEKCD
ncbi:MAG: glycosyltransferase family 2 protein [Acidithiobacillus ferrooxidans]|nr:glycosyltransferase family 2 protein [Acidithiobacillus ferrooxidans]MDD5575774.1 glycosyltransferase family 2 protein [Acidithiobacillus sp.]